MVVCEDIWLVIIYGHYKTSVLTQDQLVDKQTFLVVDREGRGLEFPPPPRNLEIEWSCQKQSERI